MPRNPIQLPLPGFAPRSWIGVNQFSRRAAEARQLARLERILAAEPRPPGDRPVCMVCHAPCGPNEMGHATCTGRRAA